MAAPLPDSLRAEALVIGSGAGGAPAAALLAEAGFEVLVLEAGPRFEARDFTADEGEMRERLGRALVTADGLQNLYAGSCVGGSTVINDALCWRPPPEVLGQWREEHDLAELEGPDLHRHVDRVWEDIHAEPTRRSHINRNAYRLELGAHRLGWDAEAMPRNVRGCACLGRCNFGCPTNAKQSMLVTYVPRAERAGGRVLASTRAERIRVEAGRVAGVEATRLDPVTHIPVATLRIDAPLVLLAAGVLHSGALLLRSGIRGRAETAGRDLQFHSSVYVTARFDEPVHGYYGPTMAVAVSQFSDVNGHAGPGYMLENSAVHPLITASALPGFGVAHERAISALPYLAHSVVVLRDRARGRVSLDGDGRPEIHYELLPEDLERLRHAVGSAARAYLAAGAREVTLPLHGYGAVRRSADLERLARFPLDRSRLSLLYAVHLFGGAALSRSPQRGFCSSDGACWDVRGLYVCDASSLPGNTGVNPQVTIMANARRIAQGIVATRRPS